MNVAASMCASSGQAITPSPKAASRNRKGDTAASNRRETGFTPAGLCIGVSRMRRKSHVRFFGEGVVAKPPPYPAGRAGEFTANRAVKPTGNVATITIRPGSKPS